MKRILIGIAVALLIATNAFAVSGDNVVRPVAGYNDTTAKYIFNWNETPWIYIQDGALFPFPYTIWYAPGNVATYTVHEYDYANSYPYGNDGDDKLGWFTPHAPTLWSSMRLAGEWRVEGVKGNGGGLSNDTTFTVTPEPMSSALLLFGGITLAAVNFYRNKRKA